MGGSCVECHSQPQDNGDGVPPGGRRAIVPFDGNPNDFGNTSHHVHGEIESGDCTVCHDLSRHQQGRVRLKDPDDPANPGAVIELTSRMMADPVDAAALLPFCLNCHDDDGDTPFSDGRTPPYVDPGFWSVLAHNLGGAAAMPLTCTGDGAGFGCHGNAHGSPSVRLLSSETTVTVNAFCYNCHTDGILVNNALSGGNLADDIQQAFTLAAMHDLGTTFTVGGNTYTLQCTSCHNPHVATGKHWEADLGKSSVTRPDFSDPMNNPRAMGTTLWGAVAGEKIDDYAGAGTYSTPNGDIFPGDQLPDYNTFCEDCHVSMPAPSGGNPGAHGDIQFSVDPHGRGSANVPDGGATCPNYYTCGRAVQWDGDDCTGTEQECWPVIPRGRGEQIWSRSPYYQGERIAGIKALGPKAHRFAEMFVSS